MPDRPKARLAPVLRQNHPTFLVVAVLLSVSIAPGFASEAVDLRGFAPKDWQTSECGQNLASGHHAPAG